MAAIVNWDENKNQVNIRKHGIDFSTMVAVLVRIISARYATSTERKAYEEGTY
jgi:uncharacterized DUF497 family protein